MAKSLATWSMSARITQAHQRALHEVAIKPTGATPNEAQHASRRRQQMRSIFSCQATLPLHCFTSPKGGLPRCVIRRKRAKSGEGKAEEIFEAFDDYVKEGGILVFGRGPWINCREPRHLATVKLKDEAHRNHFTSAHHDDRANFDWIIGYLEGEACA